MAVIYSCAEGCILDHEAALMTVYKAAELQHAKLQGSTNTIDNINASVINKSECVENRLIITSGIVNNHKETTKLTAEKNLPLSSSTQSKTFTKEVFLRPRHGLFSLDLPFLMDSQFQKLNEWEKTLDIARPGKVTVSQIHQALMKGNRKRKKQHGEPEDTKEMLRKLHQVHLSLVKAGQGKGVFCEFLSLPLNNNLLSRQLAQCDLQEDIFLDTLVQQDLVCEGQDSEISPKMQLVLSATVVGVQNPCQIVIEKLATISNMALDQLRINSFEKSGMVHRHIKNEADQTVILKIDHHNFVIPPKSGFLLSNFRRFCQHLYLEILDSDGFDLIVADPPWENKSVKRKKSYDMIDETVLLQAPIPKLAKQGCLVALWVTNNDRLKDFAACELFPAWGIKHIGIWIWLKVTNTGDTVTDIHHRHKKPYELLLLGRYEGQGNNLAHMSAQPPESYVLISVPCCLHSKKVPLEDVLSPYLPASPRCLELFARNLWPGWTSWGMEALKHQNSIFFEETPPDETPRVHR